MRGFSQSLNVSVAAAVSLFRAVERRQDERGRHGDLPEEEAAGLRQRFYTKSVKQRTRIAKAERAAERRDVRRRTRQAGR
jgi:tRNA (guanosine-2'-O-)-methyltransferase